MPSAGSRGHLGAPVQEEADRSMSWAGLHTILIWTGGVASHYAVAKAVRTITLPPPTVFPLGTVVPIYIRSVIMFSHNWAPKPTVRLSGVYRTCTGYREDTRRPVSTQFSTFCVHDITVECTRL